MRFNNSEGFSYFSQRNNKKRPGSACNVTAATQACALTGNEFNHPDGIQPEDYLMSILESGEAKRKLNSIFPWAKFNPWNTSHVIAWAVNKAVGKTICEVKKITLQEMLYHILVGGAIVVGGKFTRSGHFITVVGWGSDQFSPITQINKPTDIDINLVTDIIIDDPWGDYTTGYRDPCGNDITLHIDIFMKLVFGKNKTKTAQLYYPTEVA